MFRLVTANITHRVGRTIASVFGVALGVVLIVLTIGLVRGLLRDRGERDAQLGFELVVSLRGQQGLSFTSMPLILPVQMAEKIKRLPGVAHVALVGQQLEMKGESGLGIRQIDGVEFASLAAMSNLRIVAGQALPSTGDFMIVDTRYAEGHKTKLGDKLMALGREFTIVGIYSPETGARMMIPLSTMQEIQNAPDACSMLYIKCEQPNEQTAVATSIAAQVPEARILHTRDLPELFAYGYQGFNVFLNVVLLLAAFISVLVILLTMYTSVTERTRQIGILKSLGASRRFIASAFVGEALGVSIVGVGSGFLIALLVRWILTHWFHVKIALEAEAIGYAILMGVLSGMLGALYPALRAANQDPLTALSYE